MDTVVLDGVSYVKASVAAKQFRYTQDYIGQLCRGKKIDARLVGRTWFVNIDSIKAHRNSRYQKEDQSEMIAVSEINSEVGSKATFSRKTEIRPFVKKVTLRQVQELAAAHKEERQLRVSYEFDDGSLVPTIHKKREIQPHSVTIEHVDAKKVSILGANKSVITFKAEELPTVSLSGQVPVFDFQEETIPQEALTDTQVDVENIIENKDISDTHKEKGKAVDLHSEELSESTRIVKSNKSVLEEKSIDINKPHSTLKKVQSKEGPTRSSMVIPDKITSQATLRPSSFTPQSVKQQTVESVPMLVLVSPLIATLLAFGFVIFILLASTSVRVQDSMYESHLTVQVANLVELLRR
jgi:hypothetical protein